MSEFLKNSQSLSACVILDNQYLLKDFWDLKGDEPDATPSNVSIFSVVLMIQDLVF